MRSLIITLILCFSSITVAKSGEFSITTLGAPIPVQTDNKQLLVYELHIVNKGDKTRGINRIEIRDGDTLLTTYASTKLMNNSLVYADKPVKESTISLKHNMGVFIYVWIEFAKNAPIPNQLNHKIWSVRVNNDQSFARVTTFNYALAVNKQAVPVLGAPLTGKNWVAVAAIDPNAYHRRTILPIDGKFYLSQRFAIDWEQIVDGKESHGNMHENTNWYAYGHKILAVADGKIVNLGDSLNKDNTPPGFPNPGFDLKEVPGNFVILSTKQQGKEFFVFYAHMQPGSIRVKIGETVKKGQVIGIVGNTGNSSAPHLHMHVSSTNEPLKTNGIPFEFEETNLMGMAHPIDDTYGLFLPEYFAKPKVVKNSMPTAGQIVDFPN